MTIPDSDALWSSLAIELDVLIDQTKTSTQPTTDRPVPLRRARAVTAGSGGATGAVAQGFEKSSDAFVPPPLADEDRSRFAWPSLPRARDTYANLSALGHDYKAI